MAKDLLAESSPKILGAWDLTPAGFTNRVRVLSLPNVIDMQSQLTFDSMLEEESQKFEDVVWRPDVGSEITIVGTPIAV